MLKIYAPFEGHKPRLSSRFSWPIGLEALSNCLAGVPQFDRLQVWFDDHPIQHCWTLTMDKVADQKLSYQVLRVWYSVSGRESNWYLMMYPVESRLRRQMKELLETEGIQHIQEFLNRDFTETELQTSHHFRCVFNPTRMALAYKHEEG